eukprot:UN03652
MTDDYTKWRYKDTLERDVQGVIKVFLKNIKFFEDWKRDNLNLMILGSGYCFEYDLDYIKEYVGKNGKFFVDQDTSTTLESLHKKYGDNIPEQFVMVECDVTKMNDVPLNDQTLDKNYPKSFLHKNGITCHFLLYSNKKMDIIISGLILSQMRMGRNVSGKEQELVDSHIEVLKSLRQPDGHILIHDDCLMTDLIETREQIT